MIQIGSMSAGTFRSMRVPLTLAALAPVEHGAYAWEAGPRDGEVERCMVGRALRPCHAGTLRTLSETAPR